MTRFVEQKRFVVARHSRRSIVFCVLGVGAFFSLPRCNAWIHPMHLTHNRYILVYTRLLKYRMKNLDEKGISQ